MQLLKNFNVLWKRFCHQMMIILVSAHMLFNHSFGKAPSKGNHIQSPSSCVCNFVASSPNLLINNRSRPGTAAPWHHRSNQSLLLWTKWATGTPEEPWRGFRKSPGGKNWFHFNFSHSVMRKFLWLKTLRLNSYQKGASDLICVCLRGVWCENKHWCEVCSVLCSHKVSAVQSQVGCTELVLLSADLIWWSDLSFWMK